MTETLIALLLRLSEAAGPAKLGGRLAQPHFGPAFDRLLHSGVLEEREPAELWACCDGCSCDLRARLVELVDGRPFATCLLDPGADVELEPDDLRSFSIDRRRLAELVAVDRAEFHELLPGVWSFGLGPENRWLFLILQRTVGEDLALLSVMRSAARGTPIMLVAPRATAAMRHRMQDAADVCLVDVQKAVALSADGRLVLDATVEQPAGPFAPSMTVHLSTQRVLVNGTTQPVPAQPFRFLRMLLEAWQQTGGVPKASIEAAFSGREAKDIASDLRDALSAGRRDAATIRLWVLAGGRPVEYEAVEPRTRTPMCRDVPAVKAAIDARLNVHKTVCAAGDRRCGFFDGCLKQRNRAEIAAADVVVAAHQALTTGFSVKAKLIAAILIDESHWGGAIREGAGIAVDTFAYELLGHRLGRDDGDAAADLHDLRGRAAEAFAELGPVARSRLLAAGLDAASQAL